MPPATTPQQPSDTFHLAYQDIVAALQRISPYTVRTPLLENSALNTLLGARILIKNEALQHTGAFKYRGACNRALQLTDEQKKGGIVAWSSGNHALAVASICASLNVPATIIMPEDAPQTKMEGTRAFGATIRTYNRKTDDREAIGHELAKKNNAVLVPPYDDPYIMAGQGTIGIEIMEQAKELGLCPDAVLASCSGGGLIAGIATAVKAVSPATAVYSVEPAAYDEYARSLTAGTRLANSLDASSICDSLQAHTPGELTFAVNKKLLAGGLAVTDQEVMHAMKTAFALLKLVIEPGGACPLAAILSGKLNVKGKTVAIVLSGGNVDAERFIEALQCG